MLHGHFEVTLSQELHNFLTDRMPNLGIAQLSWIGWDAIHRGRCREERLMSCESQAI
jgi:hypothetical protein